MFSTFLHFVIFAYQFMLGPCIVNRQCTVNASLVCPLLDFVLFMPCTVNAALVCSLLDFVLSMPDIIFVKKSVISNS